MSADGLVNVPVQIDAIAAILDRHPDYRVQRRVREIDRRERLPFTTGVVEGVVLDVETTGRDHRRHRVIELALQTFTADAEGVIVGTGRMRGWLEDPKEPIDPEITRLTGLRDQDVKGRSIPDGEASALIMQADVVIAHNSSFDCPFVEARLPETAGKPWACTLRDMDWREAGFEGGKLSHLVLQAGGFYDAHRGSADVAALMHLLDHRLPDGATVLSRVLANARRPTYRVELAGARFDDKDALRDRGYRWNADRHVWSADVQADRLKLEREWAFVHVFRCLREPEVTAVDWTRRHAAQ